MAKNKMHVTRDPEQQGRDKNKLSRASKQFMALILLIIVVIIAVAIYFLATGKMKEELVPPDPEVTLPASPSHHHVFKRAAVCTDGPPCSAIGRDILIKGGSAVDATIAAMFCNGIVNVQSMGLGGGFLMTIYTRETKTVITLNAREEAPLQATEDMYSGNQEAARTGPLSMGVPGELRGYMEAHKKFGILPWKDLIEPSLELCKTGYNMSKALWDGVSTSKYIKTDPTLREMFYDEKKGELKKGNSLIMPSKALCNTLRTIADKGGEELYNGSLTDTFVKDLEEAGSIIRKEDMQKYSVKWQNPVVVNLSNGETFYSVRPPGGGALVGFILQILKGYNFTSESINGINNTVHTYHRIIEAFKYAFAKRTLLGDEDFVNIDKIVANLTSAEYANQVRLAIKDDLTSNDPSQYGALFYNQPDHGTAHVSVVAPNGDAVSVTSTINYYFGSGISSKNTGILMNNVMDDFSSAGFANSFGLPGSPANSIKPKKRPMSSMSPSVIVDENGDVKMVIGASGGTKITTAVSLVIMRNLWFKQTIKESIDAPRIHHQLIPMEISYEYGNLKPVIEGLQKLGHKTSRYRERGSIICALFKNETAIYANADFRKGGDVFGLD